MTDAAQHSLALFNSGFYCAESVLLAMAEHQGIHSDLLPRIATGFCGGVARTCGQCGAVSGAIMGLGLATGRRAADDKVDAAYVLTQELVARFSEQFGSTNCKELLGGVDLGTAEGQQTFREQRLIERCKEYTARAAEIGAALLEP
jgi:C_GCAxxG_C_C family probable redox protein